MPADTKRKGKKPWIARASKFLREDLNIRAPSFNANKQKKQKLFVSGQNDVIEETVKRVFKPDLIKSLKYRNPVWTKITFKWQQTLKRLLPLGGNSEGNKITLYDSGDDAFRAMWAAIDNAKHRVWLETYILEPDNIGKRTINGLIKAAKSGCDVRLIYDYVGSTKINSTHLAPLIAAGAQVVPFNPLLTWPWKILHWGFFRNHRKILVVDDTVAFTGGMNIGDQYASPKIGGNGYFRDTHVKVEGPAVADLAKVFLGSLSETGAKLPPNPEEEEEITPLTIRKQQQNAVVTSKHSHSDEDNKGVFVQVLQSNVPRNKLHIQKAIRLTLNNAMHHCYLTTPYFVPPQSLKRAMINAAKRGVDIRILTSGVSDVILVKLASQHVYSLLLRNGVRIYELFGSTLHAKTATIDGIYSSVGSFNLDTLSHYYNLEINLTILDHRMASQLEDQFSRDIQYCTEVTLEDLEARSALRRFIHWAAYHILRILSIKPLYNRVMFRNRNLPLSPTPSTEEVPKQ